MRYSIFVFAILTSTVMIAPASAGPCGDKPCTTEQINRSLQWLGRPQHEQIGHARVLHDGGAPAAGVTTITYSRITIHQK